MAKKKTKTTPKTGKKGEFVRVPIKYNIPDTIITKFVTNSTVQIMEEELKISFFEMKPELFFEANAKPLSEIQVDCVGVVVMTPRRISKLISALQTQLDTYNSQQGKQ